MSSLTSILAQLKRSLKDFLAAVYLLDGAFVVYGWLKRLRPLTLFHEVQWLGRKPDGLRLPPASLRYLVAGTPDAAWFLEGGRLAAESIREALIRDGTTIDEMGRLLDFGCGCGRVIRHWKGLPASEVYGCDYNSRPIEWDRRNLAFAHFETNQAMPPLPFSDAHFDLIYALSVFTHLTEEAQRAWVAELSRVLRPGAYLLLTACGESYFNQLAPDERDRFAAGELVVKNATAAGHNSCLAYHPPTYVRGRFSDGSFAVVQHLPSGARGNPTQDLWVLRSTFA